MNCAYHNITACDVNLRSTQKVIILTSLNPKGNHTDNLLTETKGHIENLLITDFTKVVILTTLDAASDEKDINIMIYWWYI